MLQKGTILEARYLLAGQMASGGFADIYVASDMRLGNKPVIIKMLRSDFTEDTRRVRMFIDEINLTTFLDHENIVRVYDVIRTEEDTYLQILELIDGQDLTLIINEALASNPNYLEWLKTQQWDGKLPLVVGSAGTPFIQIPVE